MPPTTFLLLVLRKEAGERNKPGDLKDLSLKY